MAGEVLMVRESSVNPVNAVGTAYRGNEKQYVETDKMNFYEARDYLQKEYGMDEHEAYLTVQAFDNYTNGFYKEYRKFQQKKKDEQEYKPEDKDFHEARAVKLIESFIDKAPKWQGASYRGIMIEEKSLSRFKEGKIINMKGMSSWSADFPTVMRMQGEYQSSGVTFLSESSKPRVYFICNSAQPYGTSTRFMSHNQGEREITVSKKAQWKINKVEHVSDGFHADNKYNYKTYFIYVEPI